MPCPPGRRAPNKNWTRRSLLPNSSFFSATNGLTCVSCAALLAQRQLPERPQYTSEPWHLTVFCTSHPANRHSWNWVSKFDKKSSVLCFYFVVSIKVAHTNTYTFWEGSFLWDRISKKTNCPHLNPVIGNKACMVHRQQQHMFREKGYKPLL